MESCSSCLDRSLIPGIPGRKVLEDIHQFAYRLRQAGNPFAIATVVRADKPTSAKPGAKAIITADGELTGWVGGSCTEPTVRREARKSIADGQPRLLRLCPPEKMGQGSQDGVVEAALTCISGGTLEIFIEPQLSQPRLIAVGHQAITYALADLGKSLGFRVTVMGLEVTPDRFPGAHSVYDHVDLSQLEITPNTYVVVASHGNYDEDVLSQALRSNAAYISLVASKARAKAVLQYLRECGHPEESLGRLKYPAGLDIGAVTPQEIALSILAEIVQLRRQAIFKAERGQEVIVDEPAEAIDPVCGMLVEIATARYKFSHQGQTYYFCARVCQHAFEQEPERYLAQMH